MICLCWSLTLRRIEEGRWLMLKRSKSALLAWQSLLGWWKQQGDEPELWGKSAWSSALPQPSAGEENDDDEEEAEEEDADEEGTGQRGRWQWPVSEWEVASPPLSPTALFSSPPSGVAKVQRGCLEGVHLCTSAHFLLHTCIQVEKRQTEAYWLKNKVNSRCKQDDQWCILHTTVCLRSPFQCSRWCSLALVQVWARSQTPQPFWTAQVARSVLQERPTTGSFLGPPRQPTPVATAGIWSNLPEMQVSRTAQRASKQPSLQCRFQCQGRRFQRCCCDGNRCRPRRSRGGCHRRLPDQCCCRVQWSRTCRGAAGNSSSSSSSCDATCVSSSLGGDHFSREDGPYRWFKETLGQQVNQ